MKTTLLIMAAGIGSRFGTGIKQLEPVDDANHIIMDYSIHDAIEAGFNHVVFIIRKDIEKEFKEAIGNRIAAICSSHNVTVDYAFQDINDIPGELPAGRTKPWGTGQAVLAAKDVIKTPFIVINADDYYGKEGFKAVHEYLVNGGKSCMAGFVLKNTLSDNGGVTRGICKMDEQNNLTEVVETKNIVKTVTGADADGVTGSIRETAGSGTAENAAAYADNGSGTEDRSVSAAAGAEGAGNTADNAGNAAAEGAVNNGAGASTDTAETSAVGIAAQVLDFTEDSIMEWPVRGTVLVDYNMDETVYYPTLDQYRVSPAIALQAVEDAPVYAAADGQVLSVVQDACTGMTVTMELGNGYQAVYGQLKDLTVAEGDTVKEGEVIGNISAPTKYYSVEGPNLYFAMKKDGVPVDPFEYLE